MMKSVLEGGGPPIIYIYYVCVCVCAVCCVPMQLSPLSVREEARII
jgi:hypothetical protein